MAKQQVNIPSGSGGLTRFSDEERGFFRIKNVHVIVLVVIVAIIVLFLHVQGNTIFGLQ